MKTLCSIESFTGGAFASSIVKIPGASKYFKGSIVTYQNEIKEKLGIDTSNGVVNKETALAMAKAGKEWFNADICVAFTGNAGPDVLDEKPVGNVFIAINKEVYELNLNGSRSDIIDQAVEFVHKKISMIG